MPLVKDQTLTEDCYRHLTDSDALPETGGFSVSLQRWLDEREHLLTHAGPLGVRLKAEHEVSVFAEDLPKLALIVLELDKFTDGRSFTQAWYLRRRYGFNGEIRAVGDYLPDQVFYLKRTGVNAFAFDNAAQAPLILAKLNEFSVHYQTSAA
ncbi:MAG: DUF934 domain-containing protein [Methylococcales bacterium]|nr:DUF934 domain-containing protein [Methylococcales bacterium]